MTGQSDGAHDVDIAVVVPRARHIYPRELAAGDLLFDTRGALRSISETSAVHDGAVVSALLHDGHRIWLSGVETIVAVLPRETPPSITVYERVFDPADEIGWAAGDPRVIDTEKDVIEWEPDDGNPVGWAVDVLNRHGTIEPSSSPPFTERTWFSGSGVDFTRSGATVDTSAHLSGFTLAEVEQIGQRVTIPPAQRNAVGRAANRSMLRQRTAVNKQRAASGVSR